MITMVQNKLSLAGKLLDPMYRDKETGFWNVESSQERSLTWLRLTEIYVKLAIDLVYCPLMIDVDLTHLLLLSSKSSMIS